MGEIAYGARSGDWGEREVPVKAAKGPSLESPQGCREQGLSTLVIRSICKTHL